MRLYISGPMTGLPDYNYPAFHEARDRLEAAGYEAVSPTDLPVRDDWEWVDYMLPAVDTVFSVDGVAYLDGWERSKGARIERRIAERRGILVRPVAAWVEFAASDLMIIR